MTDRILRTDSAKGLCTLTLNRPDKLNALDTATFEALDAICADLEQATDRIGCVVLRGSGRAFCAGADIGGIGDDFTASNFKPKVVERFANLPDDLSGKGNEQHRRQLAGHLVQRRRADIRSYLDADTPFPDRSR